MTIKIPKHYNKDKYNYEVEREVFSDELVEKLREHIDVRTNFYLLHADSYNDQTKAFESGLIFGLKEITELIDNGEIYLNPEERNTAYKSVFKAIRVH